MAHAKFDETDRCAVIDELGRRLGVQLNRVGRRRKWLRDHSGRKLLGFGRIRGLARNPRGDDGR